MMRETCITIQEIHTSLQGSQYATLQMCSFDAGLLVDHGPILMLDNQGNFRIKERHIKWTTLRLSLEDQADYKLAAKFRREHPDLFEERVDLRRLPHDKEVSVTDSDNPYVQASYVQYRGAQAGPNLGRRVVGVHYKPGMLDFHVFGTGIVVQDTTPVDPSSEMLHGSIALYQDKGTIDGLSSLIDFIAEEPETAIQRLVGQQY